jgi:hypothetical protein
MLLFAAHTAVASPSDLITRPLVLYEHQVAAEVVIESNLASGSNFARPFSIAPDLWVGITPRLTLGIIHSDPSVDRIASGASICVRRDELLCDKPYRGGGLDGLYGILVGQIDLAAHARLLIRDLDPVKPALTLGGTARWHHGRFAITSDPYLQLGLGNNDRGNRAELWLPIVFAMQPMCRWIFEFHTGWNSDLAEANDGWHIPAALGVRAMATPRLELGGELGFTTILGPQNTAKQRVAFVTIGWRT